MNHDDDDKIIQHRLLQSIAHSKTRMSMYGYRGYVGISEKCRQALSASSTQHDTESSSEFCTTTVEQADQTDVVTAKTTNDMCCYDDSDEEDDNPLAQLGHWIEGDSLAPPCGSEIEAIVAMLQLANLKEHDVLYDLGCGDGRVCLEAFAPPFGVKKCIGVDIEDDLIARFDELIAEIPTEYFFLSNLLVDETARGDASTIISTSEESHRDDPERVIQAVRADLREVELDEATVICMYLLPEALAVIEDKLVQLLRAKKGLRLLCNSWGLSSLEATGSTQVLNASIYLYTHESAVNVPDSGN